MMLLPWRWLGLSIRWGIIMETGRWPNPHREIRFYGLLVRHLWIGCMVSRLRRKP